MERDARCGIRDVRVITFGYVIPLFILCLFLSLNTVAQSRRGFYNWAYAGMAAHEDEKASQKTPVFAVSAYGALPNDKLDDIAGIQAAVDAASAAGGGLVLLDRGQYDFDVQTTRRFVWVQSSGIHIRGYGDGADGTLLVDHHPSPTPVEGKPWLAGMAPAFFLFSPHALEVEKDSLSTYHRKLGLLEPTRFNRRWVEWASATPLAVQPGQMLLLTGQDPGDSSLLFSVTYPLRATVGRNLRWLTGDDKYKFRQGVWVERVVGNRLYLSSPVAWSLKAEHLPTLWQPAKVLTDCRVEAMRMETTWRTPFVHHLNGEHDNGHDAIKMVMTAQSRVAYVHMERVTTAIGLHNCAHITVEDVRLAGPQMHNGFVVGGYTSSCLLTRLIGGQQMHTWSFNNYATGNVFYNCQGLDPSAVDVHGGLGVYNLIDNLRGGVLRWGGGPGNTPPGIGRGLTFWNWRQGTLDPYNGRVYSQAFTLLHTPGLQAIGVYGALGQPLYYTTPDGKKTKSRYTSVWGRVRGFGEPPKRGSLYMWQVSRR